MSVPNHREDCATYLWKTTCRDCSEPVYLFGCSCGSIVLFNTPGPPWPLHSDSCIPYLIRGMRTEGYSLAQIEALIERTARYYGRPVPANVARKLAREKYQATGATQVYHLIPQGDQADVVGTITNINWQVNLLRRLGLDNGVISRGFLGKHAKVEYAELTIRTAADEDTGLAGEHECLYPAANANHNKIRSGLRVIAHVKADVLVDGRKLWICNDLAVV